MTDDLIPWLRAQLDEDEAHAQAAMSHPEDDGRWTAGAENWQVERIDGVGITIYDEGGHTADQAQHIALWDPARVLAEVDAKRRILDCFVGPTGEVTGSVAYGGARASGEYFLKLLALPYADRPGYRKEWKP